MISQQDLDLLQQALPSMTEHEKRKHLTLLKEYQKEMTKEIGVESW